MVFPFPHWLYMAAGFSMAPRLVLKTETTVAPPLRENRELYRWGVPPVVIRCVHWTMQMWVLQTWIKALGLYIVMFLGACRSHFWGDIIMTCLDNWCAPGVYVKRPYWFLRNSCVSPSYWYDIAWVDRPGLTGLCNVCMGVSLSKGPLKLTPDGFLASVPLSIFRLWIRN